MITQEQALQIIQLLKLHIRRITGMYRRKRQSGKRSFIGTFFKITPLNRCRWGSGRICQKIISMSQSRGRLLRNPGEI